MIEKKFKKLKLMCRYINKDNDNSEVKYRTEIIKNNEQKNLKFVKIKLTKYHRNKKMTKTFKLNLISTETVEERFSKFLQSFLKIQ